MWQCLASSSEEEEPRMLSRGAMVPPSPAKFACRARCPRPGWAIALIGLVAFAAPFALAAERPMPRPEPISAASLARAAERLGPRQLDSVSAGAVSAAAVAQSLASGTRVSSASSTRTFARLARLLSINFRTAKGSLVLVESAEDREVEIAFANARARTRGNDPRARCSADVRFSGPADFLLVEKSRLIQPQIASCQCTTFGFFVLPD